MQDLNILNLIRLGFSRKQMWFAAVDSSSQFFTLFRKLQSNDALLLPLLTAWRTFSKDALASQTSGANTTLNRSWTAQISNHRLALRSEGVVATYFFHDTHPANAHGLKKRGHLSTLFFLLFNAITTYSTILLLHGHPLNMSNCQISSMFYIAKASSCLCLCACVPCCLCHGCQNWETADKRNGAVCSATYIGDHLAVNISFPVWVWHHMLSLSLHRACNFLLPFVLKLQEQTSDTTTYAAHAHSMSLFLHITPVRLHRQAAHLFT